MERRAIKITGEVEGVDGEGEEEEEEEDEEEEEGEGREEKMGPCEPRRREMTLDITT